MRQFRLTAEEARICHAPRVVDNLGALALSLHGEWREDALFMILTAYVDESGMGNEDHCTVAGFVGKLGRWQHFNEGWRKLLAKAPGQPDYVHLIEIQRREGPFWMWDSRDIDRFYKPGIVLAKRHAEFGLSVTVSREDYQKYRDGCPPKTSPDSIYGLCVRMFLDYVVHYFRESGEKHAPCVNFIFDQGKRTGEAEAIFNEMKAVYDDCGRILGAYSSDSIQNHYGLQIADFFAARARKLEGSDVISQARIVREGDGPERVRRRPAPLLHVGLGDFMWDVFWQEKGKNRGRLRLKKKLAARAVSGGADS